MNVHQRKNGRWFEAIKKLWLVLSFLLFASGGSALAEEQFQFTLGMFPVIDEMAQNTMVQGYWLGVNTGCILAGGEKGSHHCDNLIMQYGCGPLIKIRDVLNEIADKDKYKDVLIDVALLAVGLGCSNNEFNYAKIYSDLDRHVEGSATDP